MLKNLNIGWRLMLSFLAVIAVFIVALWFIYERLMVMDRINGDIKDNNLPQLTALSSLNDSINGRGITLRNLALIEADKRQGELETLRKMREQGNDAMTRIKKQFVTGAASGDEIKQAEHIIEGVMESRKTVDELVRLIEANDAEKYKALLFSKYDPQEDQVLHELDALSSKMEEGARVDGDTGHRHPVGMTGPVDQGIPHRLLTELDQRCRCFHLSIKVSQRRGMFTRDSEQSLFGAHTLAYQPTNG